MNSLHLDHFDRFSALTWKDHLLLGKTAYQLGQITTDYLNLDKQLFLALKNSAESIAPLAHLLLDGERTSINETQLYMNAVFDILRTLPPYCDLPMDLATDYNALLNFEEDDALWGELMTEGTEQRRQLQILFQKLETLPNRIAGFQIQVAGTLELYFENLPKRNESTYGQAFYKYYQGAQSMAPLFFSEQDMLFPFEQSFDVSTRFIPIRSPEKESEIVVGEETLFDDLVTFLYIDFYRGIIQNNVPRRCHNCGRYFLLTAGYNTCYCNNIAPGETEKTCRKVGAHRKEKRDKANETPAQKNYRRTYNRLKQRKTRGKISIDEWNGSIAKAQALLEQSERGELTDEELIQKLNQL